MDDDASIHDRLLWAIHMSGFDDLVKFLASAQSEQQWSMHVLEIISLMFRDQVGLHNDLEAHIENTSCFLCLSSSSFLTDTRSFGERWSCSFSRGEAERLSGAGGTEAEGAGRETFSYITKRKQVTCNV